MVLIVDGEVDTIQRGHDSAFSLTPIPGPESSAEHEDHDGMEEIVDEEGEDIQAGINDNDSTYGGSLIGCDTATLASYITDYRYENGRRYHAYRDGEYWVTCPFNLLILHC
jgi:hypothetical protein